MHGERYNYAVGMKRSAQAAAGSEVFSVFEDLFGAEGSELYLKPTADFFGKGYAPGGGMIFEHLCAHRKPLWGFFVRLL